ncbi:MAG TPA: transporter [Candidatus Paceibacterota bacterium]|nr:transporter [Candidatus Paceibacterota bacterium]
MKQTTQIKTCVAALSFAATVSTGVCAEASASWLDKAISPVANPIYFEDPRITSEIRPIFIQQWLPDTFKFSGGSVALGGEVHVYAVQLRAALSDRLALIATKDGYIEFQPENTLGHAYGWADLAAGLKYALIDDREKQLIVTPGFTVTLPTGNERVFQGHGKGEENIFVSAEKGWDNLHLTGNVGVRIPNDFDKQTCQSHYSLQLDYYTCQYFIPFVVANGYTVLSEGADQGSQSLNAVPLNAEGYDLINFGACAGKGYTQITLGGGARAKLTDKIDIGVAYEAAVAHPAGVFDSRVTADVVLRW